ncbi:MAG: hypothetical protein PHO14_03740 [Kiritimatiellae bacterium]|jgi:hypothetical protein|nr:hypothetical protein [Kiritimatiellia bacterium]MDD4341329.1 hypothetical protein [Kiritimatiellia bacterium]MDY0149336.1 hypothetical protein [Kiritimatiellia bacterium]
MNLVRHIFKKDVRHLRGLLTAWGLLVLLQAGLSGSGLAASADNMAWEVAFGLIGILVPLLQNLLVLVMVPLLIQDEPLVGTTAFWFTRPISWRDLLKSKVLFCGGLLLLLPLGVEVAVLAANQASLGQLVLAVPEILLNRLGTLMLVAALAVLTPTFARFILVAALALVAYMLIQFSITIATAFINPMAMVRATQNPSLVASKTIVGGLLGVLGYGAVLAHQYRTRRTPRSVLLLTGVVVLLTALPYVWKFDFMKAPGVAAVSTEDKHDDVRVTLVTEAVDVSDHFRMSGKEGRTKSVRGLVQVEGGQLGYEYRPQVKQARFTFQDGFEVTQKSTDIDFPVMDWNDASLEHVLDGRLVSGRRGGSYNLTSLFDIKDTDYTARHPRVGRLDATVDLEVFRYVVTGAIPLKANERIELGTEQAVITDVLEDPTGRAVILRERTLTLLLDRQAMRARNRAGSARVTYLLRNQAQRELVLSEKDVGHSINMMARAVQRLSIRSVRLKFGDDEGGLAALFTPEWLAGAELVRVEAVPVGTLTRELKAGDVKLSGSSRRMFAKSKTPEEVTAALDRIQLPENPTEDDIRVYIRAVRDASAGQREWGPRDRQVGMLQKIGSAHLELLVEEDPDSHYLSHVVPALITEEHQAWVVEHLRMYPWLAKVVWKNEWTEAARPELIKGLRQQRRHLPSVWIKAVASFEDPATYDDLVDYFVSQENRENTYQVLSRLEDIDLDAAVARAWKNARFESDRQTANMIPIAIAHGHEDALRIGILDGLGDTPKRFFGRQAIRHAVEAHTEATGTDQELADWYQANKLRLVFDPQAQKFRVE